jgi:DNA modification methylase
LDAHLEALAGADWSFAGEETSYLTHNLHPYPARFPPQIPRLLIANLSEPGDLVLDPFCGCGTTLLEAVLAGRNAIGIDANPLAVLISRAKTQPLSRSQIALARDTISAVEAEIQAWYGHDLFAPRPTFEIPHIPKLDFWFKEFVVNELAIIRQRLFQVPDQIVASVLKVAFSSVIVTVSNQDSDTRYVRREKRLKSTGVLKAFKEKALAALHRIAQLNSLVSGTPTVHHADARSITFLNPETIRLVVTSPPYPNAYSYHLYHRNRMLWLEMDPDGFKRDEIGSHRKYSRKQNGETEETFLKEMIQVFSSLHTALVPGGICAVVIGDSLIRGRVIANDELFAEVAADTRFRLVLRIGRQLQQTKRAFNPRIGRISTEHVLLLQKE